MKSQNDDGANSNPSEFRVRQDLARNAPKYFNSIIDNLVAMIENGETGQALETLEILRMALLGFAGSFQELVASKVQREEETARSAH
jgi:hypothetical protein